VGGTGADTIKPGAGHNIIAFNRGDGADTLSSTRGSTDTLTLGGGIRYSDLKLSKSGNDLVFDFGVGDKLTLDGWYASNGVRSLSTLQIVVEATPDFNATSADPLLKKRIETFDFGRLVSAFDTARAHNSKLTAWAMAPSLPNARVSGSNTEALGGVLAHEYGLNQTVESLPLAEVQDTLADSRFGLQPQPFASARAAQASAAPSFADTSLAPANIGSDATHTVQKEPSNTDQTRGQPQNDWENALARWLSELNAGAASSAQNTGTGPSAIELEIAASWRRTQQLLEAHLLSSAASPSEYDGAYTRNSNGLLAVAPPRYDTLGRISNQPLPAFAGLDEGLKVLNG
jgi:hypothetical protein